MDVGLLWTAVGSAAGVLGPALVTWQIRLQPLEHREAKSARVDDQPRSRHETDGLPVTAPPGRLPDEIRGRDRLLAELCRPLARGNKDFERAGVTDKSRTGDVDGNPLGMHREQVLDYSHVRPVSDVWGIAATFYNMLTGAMVRDLGYGRDPLNVILNQPPVPIRQRAPSVPRPLPAVVDRALREDPAERYQTADEFRQSLIEVL